MDDQPGLARRLGTTDAVVIGLGSMIGAGVFSAFGPAARAAGAGLLIGLGVAAAIAYCNATASAQLAAVYPTSGGTYIYGRERLGPWWGFFAGWGFVIGKSASCAAMALTVASLRGTGLHVGAADHRGRCRASLTALELPWNHQDRDVGPNIVGMHADCARSGGHRHRGGQAGAVTSHRSSGLLQRSMAFCSRRGCFFSRSPVMRVSRRWAKRSATLRTPSPGQSDCPGDRGSDLLRSGWQRLLAAGPDRLAHAAAPLVEAVRAAGMPALVPVITVGAALASMGALLALVAGLGRTVLAMARHRDLPGWLAAVHPRYQVPHHAEVALGVVVCVLVATVDLRGMIGFSSFGVLIYYAIANAAAYTLPAANGKRRRRILNACGLIGCLLLVATLPWQSAVAGLIVFAVGIAGRAAVLQRRTRGDLSASYCAPTASSVLPRRESGDFSPRTHTQRPACTLGATARAAYSPAARETRAKRLSGPHASRTAAMSSATSKSSSNSTGSTSIPLSRNAFNVSSPVSG